VTGDVIEGAALLAGFEVPAWARGTEKGMLGGEIDRVDLANCAVADESPRGAEGAAVAEIEEGGDDELF
jgi:hypothetical protein